tara:strand:+ start:82 stop:246 length:165 start_codon:yes stop_codon:yes gene_type:complete
MIYKIVTSLGNEKFLIGLALDVLQYLADQTTNKLDDKLVAMVRERLQKEVEDRK